MLDPHVAMLDIDVNHWRNLQDLLIVSAKERPRIVVIHEGGKVLKCVNSTGGEVKGAVDTVDDPRAVARRLYEANSGAVDLVLVFERRGFDDYFAEVQGAWSPEEDLDEYVRRAYATMDKYADAMVTYPGPANTQLGLQWRFGVSYDQVKGAVSAFVPADSAAVFGVFDEEELWATLVLGFSPSKSIDILTTVDPSRLKETGSVAERAAEISAWVNEQMRECALSIFFTDVEAAHSFLDAADKRETLIALRDAGRVIIDRAPAELAPVLG